MTNPKHTPGEQIEIVFDPENLYSHAQGMHIIISTSQQLHAHIAGALKDGFTRIYMHLSFNPRSLGR